MFFVFRLRSRFEFAVLAPVNKAQSESAEEPGFFILGSKSYGRLPVDGFLRKGGFRTAG